MQKIYSIFNWVMGILFLIGGLGGLFEAPLAGICLITAGALLLPPARKMVFSKTNKRVPALIRFISVFILFGLFGFFTNKSEDSNKSKELAAEERENQEAISLFNNDRNEVIDSIRNLISCGNYEEAITETDRLLVTEDSEIEELNKQAITNKEELENARTTEELLAEVENTIEFDYRKYKELYTQLSEIHPNNDDYKEKIAFYSEKIIEDNQRRIANEERQKNIESQFSSWNGSHRNLERLIKSSMNDPDSYDHVETTYVNNGNHLRVVTRFRGRNAFGGVITEVVEAKVGINGQILEVVERR